MAASFASVPTFSFVNSSRFPRKRFDFSCSKKTLDDVRSCSSGNNKQERGAFSSLKECALSLALSVGLIAAVPSISSPPDAYAVAANPAIPDVSVLISGPPIKDPGALLRYALPIDNKAIREVQKPLEDISLIASRLLVLRLSILLNGM